MKVPLPMILDFAETRLSAEEVADLLTMAGIEVEDVEEVEGDPVLNCKVVSNRGDALSALGLAREVLAKDPSAMSTDLYRRACLRFPLDDSEGGDAAQRVSVSIEDEACTRYACRMFEGIAPGQSPDWIQKRLRQAGMRPLSLLVDLSNYVMLEVGQPLHAFDFHRLAGAKIVIRGAQNSPFTTLDGAERAVDGTCLMICDGEKEIGVAGVMGGLDSEVTDSTTVMLLESAHFESGSIRRTRKKLGLNTEASYRFERSVDPEGVLAALNRYAELLQQAAPDTIRVKGWVDRHPHPHVHRRIFLRASRTNHLLGMPVLIPQIQECLQRLGFVVKGEGEPFEVEVPSWRPDVVREDDLIEEVGRIHGYEKIPDELPYGTTTRGGLDIQTWREGRLRAILLRLGFDQTISHTLRAEHPLDDSKARIGPRSPGSPDIALLRNSLWPSLAEAARRNGVTGVHLFEVGKCFFREGDSYVEADRAGILSAGGLYPENRANELQPEADFYTLKGALEALLPGMEAAVPASADPRLHPTRQAEIVGVGRFGQIHPDAAQEAGISADTVLAELDLRAALDRMVWEPKYEPISRNPAVRRDIAILVGRSLPFSQIRNAVELACGDCLERMWLFDVYEGKGIPEGKHSLGIAIQLRKMNENFTDEEANQVRERAVAALEALGATRR